MEEINQYNSLFCKPDLRIVEKVGGIRGPEEIDLIAPPSNKTALSSSFTSANPTSECLLKKNAASVWTI